VTYNFPVVVVQNIWYCFSSYLLTYFIGISQRQVFHSLLTDNVIGVMDDITGDVAYTELDADQRDLAEDIKGF